MDQENGNLEYEYGNMDQENGNLEYEYGNMDQENLICRSKKID